MINVINNIRFSLLNSPACVAPCENPVVAEFNVPTNSISVGESLIFTNTSQNANRYEWYVNDDLVSTNANLDYAFSNGGTFVVRLLAISDDTDCLVKSFETTITVNCVLQASINATSRFINIGDSLTVSYLSSAIGSNKLAN